MKKYICFCQSDSRMGAGPDVKFVSEEQLKEFRLYAEYIDVYEIVGERLNKEEKEKLGMRFLPK